MYILPFKSAFVCFKGVVVYLSRIWLFSVRFGLLQGSIWPFLLMATWQPCSTEHSLWRKFPGKFNAQGRSQRS